MWPPSNSAAAADGNRCSFIVDATISRAVAAAERQTVGSNILDTHGNRTYLACMPKKKVSESTGPYVPKTLEEAIIYFADEDNAFDYAVAVRWPEGVTCPYCGGWENSFIASRKIWRCRPCKKQFSVKVGTIFEDSPIRLGKWFTGVWLLTSCKNGISSYEIARALDVTQKTAWFLLHRIRAAIKAKSFDKKLAGIVETDECFIGGLFKNMHESKKQAIRDANTPNKRSGIGKTIVQAVLERDGEIRAQISKPTTLISDSPSCSITSRKVRSL
ncbi:MAG: IS1595 family transposase [Acidobacteriota bacterium]|nr:IS1595 family transposase [Acidobacteriota bacterium]